MEIVVRNHARTYHCELVHSLPKHKLVNWGLFSVDNKLYDIYRDVDDSKTLAIEYFRVKGELC